MKFLKREQINPVGVVKGDSLILLVDNKEIMRQEITETHTFTEAGIFEVNGKDQYMLGGVFIEDKHANPSR